MLAVADARPASLILEIADMARSGLPLTSAFVAEFARRLQGQGAALALALTWIEQHLARPGARSSSWCTKKRRPGGGAGVGGNSIGSLRLLGATDWPEFVETLSGVERAAAGGPGRRLRPHGLRHPRLLPAHRRAQSPDAAAARTRGGAGRGGPGRRGRAAPAPTRRRRSDERAAHVGHYLLGSGRATLERSLGMRPRWWHCEGAQQRTLWLYGVP